MATLINIGDHVQVGKHVGVVRWIGQVHYSKGTFAGVELDSPDGKNDGAVKGQRYFTCPSRHGIFRPLGDLTRLAVAMPPKESISERDVEESLVLKDQGNAKFKTADFAGAVELYTQAIAKDPYNHVFYVNRSACLLNLDEPEDALDDAEQAIELDETWWKAYFRKASALERMEAFHDAADAYAQGARQIGNEASLQDEKQRMESLQQKALRKHSKLQHEMQQEMANANMATEPGFMSGGGGATNPMMDMMGMMGGGMDMQEMLKNPEIRMMLEQDPEFQQLFGQDSGMLEQLLAEETAMGGGQFSGMEIPDHEAVPSETASTSRLARPVLRVLTLHEGAKSGDLEAIKQELAQSNHDDINEVDDHGLTPLAWAAKKGDLETCKFLVSKGARVDPLHVIKADLMGVKQSTTDDDEEAEDDDVVPFHEATHKGHLELVKFLVDSGADVEAREAILGHTAMHRAVDGNHPDVAQYLAAQSSFLVHAADFRKLSPLGMAVIQGNVEMAKLLVDLGASADEPSSPMSVLCQALKLAKKGNVARARELVDYLLQQGAKLGVWEALKAVEWDQTELLDVLLGSIAASMSQLRSDSGETVFHLAMQSKDHVQLVNKLFNIDNLKQVVDHADDSGVTCLMLAAGTGDVELVSLVLRKGAPNVGVKDNEGNTALHFAGNAYNQDVWDLLHDAGADSRIANNEGVVPKLKENPADKCCIS